MGYRMVSWAGLPSFLWQTIFILVELAACMALSIWDLILCSGLVLFACLEAWLRFVLQPSNWRYCSSHLDFYYNYLGNILLKATLWRLWPASLIFLSKVLKAILNLVAWASLQRDRCQWRFCQRISFQLGYSLITLLLRWLKCWCVGPGVL